MVQGERGRGKNFLGRIMDELKARVGFFRSPPFLFFQGSSAEGRLQPGLNGPKAIFP
jgi:hypothetical protein